MINAVVGLGLFVIGWLLVWTVNGARDYLRVRGWHRSMASFYQQTYREAKGHLPVRTGELRRSFILEAGERVVPPPRVYSRVEIPGGGVSIKACTHWPRDEVKLNDGTVAAYICRRCDHNWANEDWILS